MYASPITVVPKKMVICVFVSITQFMGYETNKYNRVINPLGRLEIYRFITYKNNYTVSSQSGFSNC